MKKIFMTKNPGECGKLCWAFGLMKSLEINLRTQPGVNGKRCLRFFASTVKPL